MEVGREAVDDAAVNHGACQPCGANGMTVVSPRVSELSPVTAPNENGGARRVTVVVGGRRATLTGPTPVLALLAAGTLPDGIADGE